MASLVGRALESMLKSSGIKPVISTMNSSANVFALGRSACFGLRNFSTQTFSVPILAAHPTIPIAASKFIFFKNMSNDWKRGHKQYENQSSWSTRSKVTFAAASALLMSAASTSSDRALCVGGPGPQVYALSHAALLFFAGAKSFRAIQSEDSKDDKQWLTFWLVFSLFELVSTVTDVLLGWLFPYYNEIKAATLIFLGVFGGAEKIYPILEPLFLSAEIVERKYIERRTPSSMVLPIPRVPSIPKDAPTGPPQLKPSNSFRAVTRN